MERGETRAPRGDGAFERRGTDAGLDRTLASRFECKYVVAPELAAPMRQFIEPFVEPDPFAARSSDLRYRICSLYLDSDGLDLYQQTVAGHKNRFKLRVRTYSDAPGSPAFFEVKSKINSIVAKLRAAVPREVALAALAGTVVEPRWSSEAMRAFETQRSLIGAKPVVKVRYMREAYQSRTQEPFRLTLDSELSHAVALGDDLGHETGRFSATPVEGLILELKYTELCPPWMNDLVRIFGLKQRPVPKYVMSIEQMTERGAEVPLSLAGDLIPPRRF